uniref:Putative secreted protein n=1 Tax=Anopheles darlingi TaxID=43151 RepID=A0A2M4DQ16_ANODA
MPWLPEIATFFVSTIVFRSASSVMCLDISVDSTISITIFRKVARCFFGRLRKMLQSSFCMSLKATAR